jgi:hypothetical protein
MAKKEIEVEPDAWDRFERAVDAAIKSGPKHWTKEEQAVAHVMKSI